MITKSKVPDWWRRFGSLTVSALLLSCAVAIPGGEAPLQLLTASYWGTSEDDDIQGGAVAADGTVYLVGNTGSAMSHLLHDIAAKSFGRGVAESPCGHAFVAHFNADLSQLLDYAELAAGIAILTSVQANQNGIYVSGYASEGLEPLLENLPSLIPHYPLRTEARLIREGRMLEANGLKDKDPIARRPGLGRLGAPCVLRFTPNLQSLTAGTYLEGWQQVWDKNRVKTIRPREMFSTEYFWQPSSLALFQSGDLAVCHDGGYFRMLTDRDHELAGTNTALLGKLAFYDCCDWVSRLSADLSKRVWRQPVFTPPVNAEAAQRIRDWPLPHYSSPRTHRMRLDLDENIYLCGWSATYTAREPWWSPYLWKLDATTGKKLRTLYEYDPLGGADNRMNGTVADTAISTMTFEGDGDLLVGLFADGGNTVMGWSPQVQLGKRFEGPLKNNVGVKLVHWWGMIHRVNAQTGEGLGGARLASRGAGAAGPAWVVDLASLPDHQVLAVGRCNLDFTWSPGAWHRATADENPVAFVRVYSRDFDLRFSTALPGVVPFEIVPLPDHRFLITGQAQQPTAPVKNALVSQPHGKADGFFCVVKVTDP